MRARTVGLAVAVGMSWLAGCGLDVQMSSSGGVLPGQPATFTIELTNNSACPVSGLLQPGDNVSFAAFLTETEAQEFASLCGLGTAPPPALSHDLATADEVPLDALRTAALAIAASSVPATCSGADLTCSPTAGGAACSLAAVLAPGASRTLTCQATRPADSGRLYSVASSTLDATGVCKAGVNQGLACAEDSDCGGTMDACASGVCAGGGNAGNGCDVDGECPDSSCTSCVAGLGMGAACLAAVGPAPAPALAPFGLGAGLIGLAALAYRRLRQA